MDMGTTSLVNPFELLCVDIDSSPADVRRAYRALALLAHPDKGGSPADMHVVQAAYAYVHAQVSAVNRTATVESLETSFAAFCSAQVELDASLRPSFAEIFGGDANADVDDTYAGFLEAEYAAATVADASTASSVPLVTTTAASGEAGFSGVMDASDTHPANLSASPEETAAFFLELLLARQQDPSSSRHTVVGHAFDADADADADDDESACVSLVRPIDCTSILAAGSARIDGGQARGGTGVNYRTAFLPPPPAAATVPIEVPIEVALAALLRQRDAEQSLSKAGHPIVSFDLMCRQPVDTRMLCAS